MDVEDELELKELEEKKEKQRILVEKVEENERQAMEKVEKAEEHLSDLVDEIILKNKIAIECALILITSPPQDIGEDGSFKMCQEALDFKNAEREFCRAQILAAEAEANLSILKSVLEKARMERIEEKNKYCSLLSMVDVPEEQLGDLDPLEKVI
jgi:hypothetical protein